MLLVGNGRVITRSEKQPFIVDGAVVIDGNMILDVGCVIAEGKIS